MTIDYWRGIAERYGARVAGLEAEVASHCENRDTLRAEVSRMQVALQEWAMEGCNGDWDDGDTCLREGIELSEICPQCRAEMIARGVTP